MAPDRSTPIIDVGGGASILISQLDAAGYVDLTVLDVSATAIAAAKAQLGPRADKIHWIEADLLEASLAPAAYSFWHDRAVFHFLTEPEDRARYLTQVRRTVPVGGHVLVAAFAEDGPPTCSGLEVARYSPEALRVEMGSGFAPIATHREEHRTPSGNPQSFTYGLFRRESEE